MGRIGFPVRRGAQRDGVRVGRQRLGRGVLVRAVQPAVPDRCRRGGAAVHRCRPVLARRWTACPYHLVDAGTPGAGGARGDRRCGDMGRALRGEPDPSHDALVLTATGR